MKPTITIDLVPVDDLVDLNYEEPKNYDANNPPKHQRLFFRGYNSKYWNGKDIAQKSGYRLLKKLSCKGCPTCDWIFDDGIRDYLDQSDDLGEIEHGATYEIVLMKEDEGWEFPHIYWYVVDIVKIKDKNGKEVKG